MTNSLEDNICTKLPSPTSSQVIRLPDIDWVLKRGNGNRVDLKDTRKTWKFYILACMQFSSAG